ncbi:hypothetical protein LCGC14_0911990 [marine sediment metagenome]|uniref:Uncharacterized protein n=1 Tax=marine sediment metagenome TaxID=412755 RepID=A0A0F9S048_9ZZZZ
MAVSTSDALLAAASCNTLLAQIDQLAVLIEQSYDPPKDHLWLAYVAAVGEWIAEARATVLEIKSTL